MNTLECIETRLGNKIELIGKSGENNVLIIGVFHGDEPQGKYIIEKYINSKQLNNNLLFIPCLNPDGMGVNKRTNANGVDLNRNFPTKNWGENKGENATCDDCTTDYYGGIAPASEIETQFLIKVIEKYSPKRILTIHAPYKVVNYDGPAKDIAEKVSNIIGYPVECSIGYPTPGSFGTYCGIERNIPTITLELDETCPVDSLHFSMFQVFDSLLFE